jgi:hypothetical protein
VAESALFGAILPFLWIYLWQNAVFLVRFCHFYDGFLVECGNTISKLYKFA